MAEARSKQAFRSRLAGRPQAWRDAIEVVATDRFTGLKTTTTEELPNAVAVRDPSVWKLTPWTGADAGSSRSPVTVAAETTRSTVLGGPCTPETTPTDKQKDRLAALFDGDEHVQVKATL